MVGETAERLPAADEVLLRRLLRKTLGRDVELLSYQIANRHADYVVLLATLQQPALEIAVKLAGPDAPFDYPFDRTALLHRLVTERTTVPVPEILAVDGSYAEWPWRYLIRRRAAGREWAAIREALDAPALKAAYCQIGAAIAQLHTLRFGGFGEIAADGTVAGGHDLVSALKIRSGRTIRQSKLRAIFMQLLEHHRALFADVTAPALCHDDLHHHNILLRCEQQGWELAAILDFDKAWAGPAESDLARLELWRGMTGDGFWPAYQALHAVAPGYAQRRPLYQLLWCLEYAVGSPQHNADTARICAELGIAPIRFP